LTFRDVSKNILLTDSIASFIVTSKYFVYLIIEYLRGIVVAAVGFRADEEE